MLPDTVLKDLLANVKSFWNSRARYEALGIPFRRGYLFYGAPGTGKTTTVLVLASTFMMNIYMLKLSSSTMTDDLLASLIQKVPQNSIILLEDIDAAWTKRNNIYGNGTMEFLAAMFNFDAGVTFSGLLNVLDGLVAYHNSILVMTTNHIDKLDPALVRPGRVDYQVHFSSPNVSEAVRLISALFPKLKNTESLRSLLTECIGTGHLQNMATLQGKSGVLGTF